MAVELHHSFGLYSDPMVVVLHILDRKAGETVLTVLTQLLGYRHTPLDLLVMYLEVMFLQWIFGSETFVT